MCYNLEVITKRGPTASSPSYSHSYLGYGHPSGIHLLDLSPERPFPPGGGGEKTKQKSDPPPPTPSPPRRARARGSEERSLRVKFQCGAEELLDVYEPSRCSYEANGREGGREGWEGTREKRSCLGRGANELRGRARGSFFLFSPRPLGWLVLFFPLQARFKSCKSCDSWSLML